MLSWRHDGNSVGGVKNQVNEPRTKNSPFWLQPNCFQHTRAPSWPTSTESTGRAEMRRQKAWEKQHHVLTICVSTTPPSRVSQCPMMHPGGFQGTSSCFCTPCTRRILYMPSAAWPTVQGWVPQLRRKADQSQQQQRFCLDPSQKLTLFAFEHFCSNRQWAV